MGVGIYRACLPPKSGVEEGTIPITNFLVHCQQEFPDKEGELNEIFYRRYSEI